MSEDSLTGGLLKARPVLADLTNRPPKRGFSALLGDSKSIDGHAKSFDDETGDSQSAKQLCSDAEMFCREKGSSVLKDKQFCGSSSTSTESYESQENTESLVSNTNLELKSTTLEYCSVGEGGDASRDSSLSSVMMETWLDSWRRSSDASAAQHKLVQGPLVTICKDGEEGLGVGSLFSTKSGSFEWSRLPKQGSHSHEFRPCSNINGSGDVGDDILKACSCSFCLKAAYIWSDLQYQDIKGRLSALKKSKKEASSLAQRNCRGRGFDVCGQGNSAKPSKLESNLTNHWKSLFCHMEDVLVNESNQLQESFLMLKDLRENCKTDLEMINGMPSENH